MLAIWVYHALDQANSKGERVSKVAMYREISEITGRSVGAVEAKVQNVSACDPRARPEKPISALPNRQVLLQTLFDLVWPGRRHILEQVYMMAKVITEHGGPLQDLKSLPLVQVGAAVDQTQSSFPFSSLDESVFMVEEGKSVPYAGARRTRSAVLAEQARKHFRERSRDRMLHCEICGVSFDGIVTRQEIMHIHHLEAISQVDKQGRQLSLTQALTLVCPVCPTCHGIIHSRVPILNLDEARKVWEEVNRTRPQVAFL